MQVNVCDTTNLRAAPLLHVFCGHIQEFVQSHPNEVLRNLANGVTLRVIDLNRWQCQTQHQIITISRRVFEVYWIAANVYVKVYRSHVENTHGGVIVLPNDQETNRHRAMLTWLMNHGPRGGINEMDEDFPGPSAEFEPGSTDEFIFLVSLHSVLFQFLHELAHEINLEESFSDPIGMETACDLQAADWMFQGRDFDSEDGRAQIVGAATAFLLLSAETIHNEIPASLSHPRCYDRLLAILNCAGDHGTDPAWGYVAAMLAIHLDNAGISLPLLGEDPPWRTIVEAQIAAIRSYSSDHPIAE